VGQTYALKSSVVLTCSLRDLDKIRQAELNLLLQKQSKAFLNADLLELGAGTCQQLTILANIARSAIGVDLPSSNYKPDRTTNFIWYDGMNLPFASNSFDVIYSSNVMEHLVNENELHHEMRRVLRRNGIAIHVVPSSTWRLWTTAVYCFVTPARVVSFMRRCRVGNRDQQAFTRTWERENSFQSIFLNLLCPQRHGEKGNRFTEWWYFRGASWRRRFEELGWIVVDAEGIGLFYSGYLLGAKFLPINARKLLARFLGSSCLIFVLKPAMETLSNVDASS